ncbi:MAG: GNAT family N-acetyltransferase [Clostridia bacterium]|nr:GNAT family N-acetyltransferase [Clostridia bacterium]
MWDTSVEKVHLAMELDSLENLPQHPLPQRYGWRFYQPGDEIHWARIETSAGEFSQIEGGLRRFERDFSDREPLPERMMFLMDGGVPFATATAWFEPDGAGLLHYVAVDAAHQGQGLSRALTGLGMNRLRELGHRNARLGTQTYSWVAIRVYHEFGFRPVIHGMDDMRGWRIVSEKTGIDFLKDD